MSYHRYLCLCALTAATMPACGYGGMFFADLDPSAVTVTEEVTEVGTKPGETWRRALSVLRDRGYLAAEGFATPVPRQSVVFTRSDDRQQWVAVSVSARDGGGSTLRLVAGGDDVIGEQIAAACSALERH